MDAKHQAFADAWLETFNAGEAYHRTHPKAKRNSCWTLGSLMLRNLEVREYIEERLAEQILSANETMSRVSNHARGSMAPFITVKGKGQAEIDLTTDDARAHMHLLKSLRTKRTRRIVKRGETVEPWEDEYIHIEIHDPQKALDMLAKYHQLYAERDDEGKPLTDEQRIARVMDILDRARARRDGQTPAAK